MPGRRCVVVQHAAPEEPGAVGEALAGLGVALDVRRLFDGDALPADLSGAGGLVVMGGPMSACDDEGFPSRRHELALVSEALDAGVPTLGVCLGAQLLALAGGGEVFPGRFGPEIGWGPVQLEPAAGTDALFAGLPATLTVLHWHGDTFDGGPGSVLLASGDRYPQALRIGERAWGLQFHVEVDAPQVARFVGAFPEDAGLAEGGAAAIVAGTDGAVPGLRRVADVVLGRFAALVAA